MLIPTSQLLHKAREGKYAVGAFNIYNLEGVRAVIASAEEVCSPVILQILPSALSLGDTALISLCLEAGRKSAVPVSVHLDHCSSEDTIRLALDAGISSVMADGSHLPYEENIIFTRKMRAAAKTGNRCLEAELGRLSGTEDGLDIAEYEARLTDPEQAEHFVRETGMDALAVCIGNVHGKYKRAPDLDFQRLTLIRKRVPIPLVLHGTSGLPDEMIRTAIGYGICKFNVNTEIRSAYLQAAGQYLAENQKAELTELMQAVIQAMILPVTSKMRLFGSAGKAEE